MPTNISPGLPQTAYASSSSAVSAPQPQTQANKPLPAASQGGVRRTGMSRSDELAKLVLTLGPNNRTQHTLRKDRPLPPAPATCSPGTGKGAPAGPPAATQAENLQSIASQSLALLELWEHMVKELPLHLETQEAHSAPNEHALRSYFTDLDQDRADFAERIQTQMSARLTGFGYAREAIGPMVAEMLDQARPPKHESSKSKYSSAALKSLCEQLQSGIGNHLRQVRQNGAKLDEGFLKAQYKQLVAARRDYKHALGYSTALSMRSELGDNQSPGPQLHGTRRSKELGEWRAEARGRADALRKMWKSAVATEAAARRDGAPADRAERPAIPAIVSVEHELSTNTGRFSAPRTAEKLGIADIIKHFFPQAPGTVPALATQVSLIPRGQPFQLTGPQDAGRLAAELAASSAPFHVLCIPGTSDGSFERSLVFRNAGTPDLPMWQLLPRTGNPVDKNVPSFGLARNPEPEAQSDGGAGIPRPGTPFPSADEKRNQPLPNKYIADPEHNQKLMRADSNTAGWTPKTTQKDIFLKILGDHVESVKNAGRSRAPVIIMSPLTTTTIMHRALARHLGYELDFHIADNVSLTAALRKAQCDLDEDLLIEDEAQSLMDGDFDEEPCGTILHLVLADKSTCTFAWNKEQRDKALVQINGARGAFASLGLQNGKMLKMTPSAVWQQLDGKLPGAQAWKFTIDPFRNGKVAALLTGEEEEDAELELMNAAREEGIPAEKLNSFQVFSYLFTKQHPGAIAATYRLNDAEDNGTNARKLGKLLDNTHESFVVEFEQSNDNGEFERRRIFFQAPGKFADKNEITGVICSSVQTSYEGPPSRLLKKLAGDAQNGTSTDSISILSTGPLVENSIGIGRTPDHVLDVLIGLTHTGLPVIAQGEIDQLAFMECLHGRNGGMPSEISGKMIMDFTHPDTGKLSDGYVKATLRLSAVPPLNAGPDFQGTLIRVPTDIGLCNITFHKDDTGNTFFIDLFGQKQPADALEQCALSQGWYAEGAIEILKFTGDVDAVHLDVLLQNEEDETESDTADSPEE